MPGSPISSISAGAALVELRQCLVDPAELVGAPYQTFRLLSQ